MRLLIIALLTIFSINVSAQNDTIRLKIHGGISKSVADTTYASISSLNSKVDKTTTVNGKALSTNIILSKSDLGLGNVDNTSDISKPVSTAVQTALNAKANDNTVAHNTGNETWSGVKNFSNKVGINNSSPLAPLHIGNANVNNSVDAEVLVSRNVDNTGTGNAHGYSDGSQITRSGGMAYASYDGRINILGTNSFDHYVSFQAAPTYSSTGTITNLYGLYSLPTITAGTVTNNYGSFIGSALVTGGSITNNYGLFIQSPTGGTSKNYSIYTNGPTPSRFQGGLISDSDIIANKNVIAAGTFKGNGVIQSTNIVGGISSAIVYTPVKQLEARSNSGEAAIRISQSGQNNWDFKSPAGKTSLVIGDVTRDYFTILNQGWFGFNTLTPTMKFEVNSQVKIDSILNGNAGTDSLMVTQGGVIKKISSATYEPAITKNTAFNKNFGTTANTVADGGVVHDSLVAINARKLDASYTQSYSIQYPLEVVVVGSDTIWRIHQSYLDSLASKNNPIFTGTAKINSDTLATKADVRANTTTPGITDFNFLIGRDYANDSLAINIGNLTQGDLYQTDGVVKVINRSVFQYTIDNTDGSANNYQIRLDANTGNVSGTIYWGDGSDTVLTGDIYYELNHTYASGSSYTVKIVSYPNDNLNKLYLNNNGSNNIKITSIKNIKSLSQLNIFQAERSNISVVDTLSFPPTVNFLSFADDPISSFNVTLPLTTLTLNGTRIQPDGSLVLAPTITVLNMNAMLHSDGASTWNATDVNNFLIRLDGMTFNSGTKTLNLVQFNSATPSGAGLTAKTSLESKGWTITTD